MKLSRRGERVIVSGVDFLAALGVGLSGALIVPLFGAVLHASFGCTDAPAFLGGLVAHVGVVLGCRYRLVADARGCRLFRTWLGIPWSRRSFGRRARVTTRLGWDWEELCIVPELPRGGEDRFVVMEWAHAGASAAAHLRADAADRAIEVAVARAATTYRRPAD